MTKEIELLKQQIQMLQSKLSFLEEIEKHNAKPKMTLENEVDCSIVSFKGDIFYRLQFPDGICCWYMKTEDDYNHYKVSLEFVDDMKSKHQLESVWKNEVLIQKNTEPYYIDDPECCSGIEWDKKDNPKPMDEVINKLIREHQAQKLFNRLVDELGYDFDACNDVVDLVEDWILDEQSSAGSQNLDTELLVEGFNDAIRKMKEMLR